jgi:hypothetical protein
MEVDQSLLVPFIVCNMVWDNVFGKNRGVIQHLLLLGSGEDEDTGNFLRCIVRHFSR